VVDSGSGSLREIGAFIRRRRRDSNLTQRELSELANVGLRLVSELERGKPTLRPDAVNRVLAVFGQMLGVVPAPGTPYSFTLMTSHETNGQSLSFRPAGQVSGGRLPPARCGQGGQQPGAHSSTRTLNPPVAPAGEKGMRVKGTALHKHHTPASPAPCDSSALFVVPNHHSPPHKLRRVTAVHSTPHAGIQLRCILECLPVRSILKQK